MSNLLGLKYLSEAVGLHEFDDDEMDGRELDVGEMRPDPKFEEKNWWVVAKGSKLEYKPTSYWIAWCCAVG